MIRSMGEISWIEVDGRVYKASNLAILDQLGLGCPLNHLKSARTTMPANIAPLTTANARTIRFCSATGGNVYVV
jgi:hypothetical protein